MRRYRLGSHAKYDLKVHLVWCPKYRKRVLTGQVAIRVRDLLRQVAAENELQIISGKLPPIMFTFSSAIGHTKTSARLCNGSRVRVPEYFFRSFLISRSSTGDATCGRGDILQ
jgi:Transposase IS200 like